MQRKTMITAALAAATLAGAGTMSTATAARSHAAVDRSTVTQNLVTPLSAAVRSNGTAYVAQNFMGQLIEKRPGKKPTVVFQAPGSDPGSNEVGAVSVRNGVVTFAVSTMGGGGLVKQATRSGDKWKIRTIADVGAFEKTANPDGDVVYGFRDLTEECAAQIPEAFGPANYTGIVETHPYATASDSSGIYLADAAANAILEIEGDGTVSTLAVLPAVPTAISAAFAEAAGLPECTVGETYYFESVPTDVEVGKDGMLYATSLPGGPDDGSAGANGAVYKVDPTTGNATLVAGGLVSAVGVAVAGNGDLYVSQLFAGQVSRIPAGTGDVLPFKSVALPSALEIVGDTLYATVNVLPGENEPPAGKLVRWAL
ncbi:MAG: repeat protein [Nocardioides sp.]|nr:repeat protein [Nocardioides sp.]